MRNSANGFATEGTDSAIMANDGSERGKPGRPKLAVPRFALVRNRDGYYAISYTDPVTGKTKTKSTSTTSRNEAEKAKERFAVEFYAPKPKPDPTIGDVIDPYLAARLPKVHKPKDMKRALENVRPFLGAYRPRELTDEVLAKYADWRMAQKRWGREKAGNVGPGTVRRDLNQLRGCLAWADRNGYLQQPAPKLRLPIEAPPPRHRFLDHGEMSRLLDAAKKTPHLALFIRIALATGARSSAILELTWDRVTWPGTENPIKWGLAYDGEIEVPKQTEAMVLDFGAGRGNKKRAKAQVKSGTLYLGLKRAYKNRKTDHVIEYAGKPVKSVKTAFNLACKRAKIKGATIHTLKHTCVSWLIMEGVSFSIVSMLTNTSEATLRRHYGHLSPSVADAIGETFNV